MRISDWSSDVCSSDLVRRAAVVVILVAAYIYHTWIAGYLPLASIGMISFCAVGNFAPPLLFGLYWRRAHRHGVIAGLAAGFATWQIGRASCRDSVCQYV